MSKSTAVTDAQLGAAIRVVFAALFTGAAIPAAALSAEADSTTKGSATDASAGSTGAQADKTPPSTDAPAPGYTAEELTTEHLTKQIMQVGAKKGKAAAKELMATFENAAGAPCERASEIEQSDIAAALDKVKEALASA